MSALGVSGPRKDRPARLAASRPAGGEGTEQEGTGAADRVDDSQARESEGVHRGLDCAIKDEISHEARGLHKRVCLAVKFG